MLFEGDAIRRGRGGGEAGELERGETEETEKARGTGECDLAMLLCLDLFPPPASCTARLSSSLDSTRGRVEYTGLPDRELEGELGFAMMEEWAEVARPLTGEIVESLLVDPG